MKPDPNDTSWEMEPEPEPVVALVESKPRPLTPKEKRTAMMAEVRDELLAESAAVIRDVLRGRDIEPGASTPPEEWAITDPVEAAKALRMANASWMPKKDAPILIDVAMQQFIGITKAMATEQAAPKHLNMTFVTMPKPPEADELPALEVGEEEK